MMSNANASTRMNATSQMESTTNPPMSSHHPMSQQESAQAAEMNNVLKALMHKEHPTGLYFEDIILEKKKKANANRGWSRPTGVKVAPMKILHMSHSVA